MKTVLISLKVASNGNEKQNTLLTKFNIKRLVFAENSQKIGKIVKWSRFNSFQNHQSRSRVKSDFIK